MFLWCHGTLPLVWTDVKRLMITNPAGCCTALRNYVEKIFICRASSIVAAELFFKGTDPKKILVGTEEGWWPWHTGHHPNLNNTLLCIAMPAKVYLKEKVFCRKVHVWKLLLNMAIGVLKLEMFLLLGQVLISVSSKFKFKTEIFLICEKKRENFMH